MGNGQIEIVPAGDRHTNVPAQSVLEGVRDNVGRQRFARPRAGGPWAFRNIY